MTGRVDRWIRRTTIGCVALLALIAETVSYLHMHALVAQHGQPGWVAVLTPLSVDGMILAASTAPLADSRSGRRGVPWEFITSSVASLAANVAVAEPTPIGRVIAAWSSFALTASYELLTRQMHRSAVGEFDGSEDSQKQTHAIEVCQALGGRPPFAASAPARQSASRGDELQRQAWRWAFSRQVSDGTPSSGKAIASAYGRHERWGRLVKAAGQAGVSAMEPCPVCRLVDLTINLV